MDKIQKSKILTKEEIIERMRETGRARGGGYRKPISGSNQNQRSLTRKDNLKSGEYYQKFVDLFYEMSIEDLDKLRKGDLITFKEKKLTGSAVSAYINAYQFKLREQMMEAQKLKAEEELKIEVQDAEIVEKDTKKKVTGKTTKKVVNTKSLGKSTTISKIKSK